MEKPFRFRRVYEISGAFVIIALAILMTGTLIQGILRGWFEGKTVYEVELPVTGTEGVREGMEVQIRGAKAGIVKRIELRHEVSKETIKDFTDIDPKDIEPVAILELSGSLVAFIGIESKALLHRDLVGLKAPFFEITVGQNRREKDDRELIFDQGSDELSAVIEQIKDKVLPMIDTIAEATTEYKDLAINLNQNTASLQKSLDNFSEMVEATKRGEGAAGVLFADREFEAQLKGSITGINTFSNGLPDTLKATDEGMQAWVDAAGALSQELNKVQVGANESLEAMTKSFLDAMDVMATTWAAGMKEIDIITAGVQEIGMLKAPIKRAKEKDAVAAGQAPAPEPVKKKTPHFKRK